MRIGVLTLLLFLAACGGAPPSGENDGRKQQGGDAAPVVPEPEPLPAPTPETELATPVAVSRFAPCPPPSPDVHCSGPIIVRAGQPVLTKDGEVRREGDQRLKASMDFTVESRTGGPVLFNLANQVVKMTLPIGTVLEANIFYDQFRSGVTPCSDPRETCVQGQKDSFIRVPPPGETAPRFQIFFQGRTDPSVTGRLPSVATASTEMEVYVLEPGQPDETVKLNFANVPVQNMMAQ